MIEKVNPSHPDKVADRIAGAIVDIAYKLEEDPKVAVEVLIGHGKCHVIIESSVDFNNDLTSQAVERAVKRIAGNVTLDLQCVAQDKHLAENQSKEIRCGDNGIFKGVPLTHEEKYLSEVARAIYKEYPSDGKYILNWDKTSYHPEDTKLIVCQSNAKTEDLREFITKRFAIDDKQITINPLGDWTGGTDVDSGATNRKLGSDMAQSVTGGGLHGKDLSKADVSVNIYAFAKAQIQKEPVELCCAIGDDKIDGRPYSEIVNYARDYIQRIGGFEKFAEWGLF